MGAAPQFGRVFDHYRLLEKIGEGGMGVVWLAEDMRLGRKVALKFLPPEAARDAGRRQRFEQEARAAAALSHPGIATVHELGETEGQSFIVFEYVPGRTLRSLVVPGGLPRDELLDIVGDIADALAAAHAAGVVHRDLKPENVMRTAAGDCKVMDFGLARLSAQAAPDSATQSHLTRAGMVLGTVGYMAPEQLEGKEIDFRCDIFSFGTLVYELATGVHPFQGGSAASTSAAILTAEPPLLTQRNPLQPAELERIVRKCLRKRRDERYQSTRDLAVDLRNLKRDSDERPSGVAAVEPAVQSNDDSLLRALFSRFRATPRRWWELHQLFVIFVYTPVALRLATGYSAMVSAAFGTALASNWQGVGGLVRAVASPGGLPAVWRSAGLALFVAIVLLLITSAVLRFYFLILAVVVPERLLIEIRRLSRLRTGADIVVGCEFMFIGLGFVLRLNIVEGAALAAFGLLILLAVVYVEPAMVRAALPQAFTPIAKPISSVAAAAVAQAPPVKPKLTRLWWWNNLLGCCVTAPLLVYLAWLGWHEASVFWGKSVFVAVVVGVSLNVGARVTFLFFAFVEMPGFASFLRRYGAWQRIGMFIAAAGLGILAVPLSEAHVGLAATLAALAIGVVAGSELVEPAMARGAFPAELARHNAEDVAPSRLRLWWWWHNLIGCCVVGPLVVYLAWLGWHESTVSWGRTAFIAQVVAIGVSAAARITLLFFAFFEVPDFGLHLRRLGTFQRFAALMWACGAVALAIPLFDAHMGLAATLASLAIVGLGASEMVEPAIARGAFPETGDHNHRDM